jgi:hypothetical protein
MLPKPPISARNETETSATNTATTPAALRFGRADLGGGCAACEPRPDPAGGALRTEDRIAFGIHADASFRIWGHGRLPAQQSPTLTHISGGRKALAPPCRRPLAGAPLPALPCGRPTAGAPLLAPHCRRSLAGAPLPVPHCRHSLAGAPLPALPCGRPMAGAPLPAPHLPVPPLLGPGTPFLGPGAPHATQAAKSPCFGRAVQ